MPRKLAVEADSGNMGRLKNKQDSKAHKRELERENALNTAKKIEEIKLELKVKAGDNGKIFGGVTSKEIAETLKNEYNIEVDKKKIVLKETIKNLGSFNIEIKLFEEISATLKLIITAL